ncbi:MAG TPA: HepT-like ribonuclease domain-containing protein [Clostridia bacterium]|nr:HepT-like ribonuclease domain-containing protein [Clostridia bacterium]
MSSTWRVPRRDFDWGKFAHDKVVRRYVERTIHMAIEACLDIANHIVSYEGFREPADNKDTFQVLCE